MAVKTIDAYALQTQAARDAEITADLLDPVARIVQYGDSDPRVIVLRKCFYCNLQYFASHPHGWRHAIPCPRCMRTGSRFADTKPATF